MVGAVACCDDSREPVPLEKLAGSGAKNQCDFGSNLCRLAGGGMGRDAHDSTRCGPACPRVEQVMLHAGPSAPAPALDARCRERSPCEGDRRLPDPTATGHGRPPGSNPMTARSAPAEINAEDTPSARSASSDASTAMPLAMPPG